LWNIKAKPKRQTQDSETRAMLGKRFKAMYSSLGFNASEAAQLLQVSERTVHNWVSGAVQIPYAAYRLLRLQLRYELPGKAWEGWRLTAGHLYTPEGHELSPHDFSWWGLLVRRAALFDTLYKEVNDLRRALAQTNQPEQRQARADAARAGVSGLFESQTDIRTGEVPVTPHFRLMDATPELSGGLRDVHVTRPFSPENRTSTPKTKAGKSRSFRLHTMAARIRDRGVLHG
jgi:Phage protein